MENLERAREDRRARPLLFACACGAVFKELTEYLKHVEEKHPEIPEAKGAWRRRGGKWELVNELKQRGLVKVYRG